MAESSRCEPGARSARPGCCRSRRTSRRKRPHSARTARPGRGSISASPPPSAAPRHRHRLRGGGCPGYPGIPAVPAIPESRHRRELRPRTGYRNPLPPRPAVVSPRTASPPAAVVSPGTAPVPPPSVVCSRGNPAGPGPSCRDNPPSRRLRCHLPGPLRPSAAFSRRCPPQNPAEFVPGQPRKPPRSRGGLVRPPRAPPYAPGPGAASRALTGGGAERWRATPWGRGLRAGMWPRPRSRPRARRWPAATSGGHRGEWQERGSAGPGARGRQSRRATEPEGDRARGETEPGDTARGHAPPRGAVIHPAPQSTPRCHTPRHVTTPSLSGHRHFEVPACGFPVSRRNAKIS